MAYGCWLVGKGDNGGVSPQHFKVILPPVSSGDTGRKGQGSHTEYSGSHSPVFQDEADLSEVLRGLAGSLPLGSPPFLCPILGDELVVFGHMYWQPSLKSFGLQF